MKIENIKKDVQKWKIECEFKKNLTPLCFNAQII